MSNVITLRNIYKVKEIHFQPGKQPNGLNFPFVKPVRYNGTESEMILSEAERNSPDARYFIPEDLDIVVTDGTTFDLDDPYQNNIWQSIRGSELIVPTRDAKDKNGNLIIDGDSRRFGTAEIYVDVPGEESARKVNKIKLQTQAYTYILNDSENGRLTKCKLLGREMYNSPSSDVADYLIQIAEKTPNQIIDLYTNGDTALKLLLIDAIAKRVIRKDNGLFMYGDTILGATEDSAVTFFKMAESKGVVDLIKYDTYPEMRRITTVEKKEEKPATKKTLTK